MTEKLISIIIPVYNGERFLSECLDSVLSQTYKNLEIIIINDGSTDSTQSVINKYKEKHKNINDYYQKNSGQGVARNKGMNLALGEYISFIDADDILDKNFIDYLFKSINKHKSDYAICDWMYYYNNGSTKFVNKNKFMGYPLLENKDTEEVLSSNVYFTVNKLYKTNFLKDNNIKYGEGYIYEDYEFYIKTAVLAKKISIVPNPHYKVRVNAFSTTKTKYNTMTHYDSFLKAIQKSLVGIKFKSKFGKYNVYKYILNRAWLYSQNRMPSKKTGKKFLCEVFKILNQNKKGVAIPLNARKLTRITLNYFLPNYKVNLFIIVNKKKVKFAFKKIYGAIKVINFRGIKNKLIKIYYKHHLNRPIYNENVLFLGFDFRYDGNSKYLFTYLNEKENYNKKIYFATDNQSIDPKKKITPRSFKYWKLLARSANIVAETWIPLNYIKRKNTIWIQLWHGTPIKKMLFDSNELYFSSTNPRHKLNKYKDIKKWDYLITENINIKPYFEEAFLIDNKKILSYGYPRVKYLVKNKNDQKLKIEIKNKYRIPLDKKIIFYAPTWRDYNYNGNMKDNSYLLNLNELKKHLSNDYFIIFKDHNFFSSGKKNDNILSLDSSSDTQELILAADILISDYSSIIFDFFAINKPALLFVTDKEKYDYCRGLYPNIWKNLNSFVVKDLNTLVKKIQLLDQEDNLNKELKKIKEIYCCKNIEYCYQKIEKLIR